MISNPKVLVTPWSTISPFVPGSVQGFFWKHKHSYQNVHSEIKTPGVHLSPCQTQKMNKRSILKSRRPVGVGALTACHSACVGLWGQGSEPRSFSLQLYPRGCKYFGQLTICCVESVNVVLNSCCLLGIALGTEHSDWWALLSLPRRKGSVLGRIPLPTCSWFLALWLAAPLRNAPGV